MKEKLKTRINAFKNDRLSQGILIGGAIGCATTLITLKIANANFMDPETMLHIPDHLVDDIVRTGLPALVTRHDGVQLSISPS